MRDLLRLRVEAAKPKLLLLLDRRLSEKMWVRMAGLVHMHLLLLLLLLL